MKSSIRHRTSRSPDACVLHAPQRMRHLPRARRLSIQLCRHSYTCALFTPEFRCRHFTSSNSTHTRDLDSRRPRTAAVRSDRNSYSHYSLPSRLGKWRRFPKVKTLGSASKAHNRALSTTCGRELINLPVQLHPARLCPLQEPVARPARKQSEKKPSAPFDQRLRPYASSATTNGKSARRASRQGARNDK